VVNALVGVPTATIFVDGVPAEPVLMFGAAPEYIAIPPGPHTVTLTPAIPLGAVPPPPVISTELTVAPGRAYTLFAVGDPSGAPPTFLALADEPASGWAGQVGIRFVNASPDAPSVDVALPGGAILARGVGFGEASPYLVVPPGTVELEVRLAGTPSAIGDIQLGDVAPGRAYTVAAVGLLAGAPPLAFISISDL
jgi:hypothetical protein